MPYPQIEITVKYKCKGKQKPLPFITDANDAWELINEICDKREILWREEMLMICLNSGNQLQGWYSLSKGGVDYTASDIRIIATIAAKCAAYKVILAHNHPSKQLTPSEADVIQTHKVYKGLATIECELIDHIIFTDNDYLSMKNNGFM